MKPILLGRIWPGILAILFLAPLAVFAEWPLVDTSGSIFGEEEAVPATPVSPVSSESLATNPSVIGSVKTVETSDTRLVDSTQNNSWIIEGMIINEKTGEFPLRSGVSLFANGSLVALKDDGSFETSVREGKTVIVRVASEAFEEHTEKIDLTEERKNVFVVIRLKERLVVVPKADHVQVKRDSTTGIPWSITGYVVDAATELPLRPDSVRFDGDRIVVGEKSRFRITTRWSGVHTVEARLRGYHPFVETIELTEKNLDRFVVVALTDTSSKIIRREIVVSAKKQPLHAVSQVAAVEVEQKEIQRTAAILSDPLRVLPTLPGVTTESEFSARPIVRGGDMGEARVDLDGISLIQPYHFGGVKSVFNTASVNKMTLYKSDMPAEFHNAQSAVVAVESRRPLGKPFDLIFDVNFLQFNLYGEYPIVKDKIGLSFASQGSYFDWMVKRITDLATSGDDEIDSFQELFYLPDYQDYAVGVGMQINDRSKLTVANMHHTDRFQFVIADSSYTYRYYYPGLDTSIDREFSYNYSYDYGFSGSGYPPGPSIYDSSSGRWIYPNRGELIAAGRDLDTAFIYKSKYNILSALWENTRGDHHVFKSSLAWQRRTWDIIFLEDFEFIQRQRYDVFLDQVNLHQLWLYSGIENHLLKSGLQYDHTFQEYDVELPRLLHEMITKGSTNFGDFWGPMYGDTGFVGADLEEMELPFYQSLSPRIVVSFAGNRPYGNLGAYCSDAWDVTPDFKLKMGARLEGSSLDRSVTLSPRTSAHYRLNSKNELTGTVGLFTQNNYEVSQVALSRELRPEKVWHFGAGLESELLPWLDQEIDAYYKHYFDLISERIDPLPATQAEIEAKAVELIMWEFGASDSGRARAEDFLADLKQNNPREYRELIDLVSIDGRVYQSHFTNDGSGLAFGFEYFLRYRPADWWHGWLSFTASHSRRKRDPAYRMHPFPLDRPFMFSLVNYYRLKRSYEIGLKYNVTSGIPYTFADPAGKPFTIGPYNGRRYGLYHRFDMRITKGFRFLGHQGHFYSEVWNATNTPNSFLADSKTKDIKAITLNMPVTILFLGVDFKW